MKKIITALTVALALSTVAYAGYTYGQCQALTKKGTRCLHGVSAPGDKYCWQHK